MQAEVTATATGEPMARISAAPAAGPKTPAVCWLALNLPLPSAIWSPSTISGR